VKNNVDLLIKFVISFVISFIIVGYIKNGFMIKVDWVAGATIWSKLKWYYVYNFMSNLFPSLILAILVFLIYYFTVRKKLKK
jgi:hypothetical protein